MKTTLLFIFLLCASGIIIPMQLNGQSLFNAEVFYATGPGSSHGASLGFEYEKYYSEAFSLPLKAEIGYSVGSDYNSLSLEIHKGFRKYFGKGFFAEQSIGIGMTANYYTIESIWYYDRFSSVVRYADGANWGFSPSATLGLGYNLTHNKKTQNLIWVRPKVYWNFGVRGLNLPYSAIQLGYTYNFKTKG